MLTSRSPGKGEGGWPSDVSNSLPRFFLRSFVPVYPRPLSRRPLSPASRRLAVAEANQFKNCLCRWSAELLAEESNLLLEVGRERIHAFRYTQQAWFGRIPAFLRRGGHASSFECYEPGLRAALFPPCRYARYHRPKSLIWSKRLPASSIAKPFLAEWSTGSRRVPKETLPRFPAVAVESCEAPASQL